MNKLDNEIVRSAKRLAQKECVRCHKPFVPASNRKRCCASCEAAAKQARTREKQRRYRERQKTPL